MFSANWVIFFVMSARFKKQIFFAIDKAYLLEQILKKTNFKVSIQMGEADYEIL